MNTVKEALKQWVVNLSEKELNIPYLMCGNKTYTLKDIYDEVDNETEFGKEIEVKMISLTIDLLIRGKEKL